MQHWQWTFLYSDIFLYLIFLSLLGFIGYALKRPYLKASLKQVLTYPYGMISSIILALYLSIALLDSIHFYDNKSTTNNMVSLLDFGIGRPEFVDERTYSAPLAIKEYGLNTTMNSQGQIQQTYLPLKHINKSVGAEKERVELIKNICMHAVTVGFLINSSILILLLIFLRIYKIALRDITIAWRSALACIFIVVWVLLFIGHLQESFHLFGTGKIGQDIFIMSMKSVRTGLVIGTVTSLIMLPLALMLGIMAGYYKGAIDDIIQYIYTTLSSIPGVLLIAASILSIQVFINNHPSWFPSLSDRADIRLLSLCLLLGLSSWTSLCRILRGEALKLSEMDYVKASRTLGASHYAIMRRHILPNVVHIILLAIVLDFSGLVLAEAVLSYVGVGVDPLTLSWGQMINSARLELARDPIVWWPLLTAFSFMFILVLAANLFSDALRDAFDPRLQSE